MKRARAAAILSAFLLLVGAACSSSDPPGVAKGRPGTVGEDGKDKPKDGKPKDGKGKGKGSTKGDGDDPGDGQGGRGDGSPGDGSGSGSGDGHGSGGGSGDGSGNGPGGGNGGTDIARAYAARGDADSDAEAHGDTPAYIEIVRASVDGLGDQVKLTLTLAADVPDAMPDGNTFMAVGFRFDGKGDDEPYVYADADDDGWVPGTSGADTYPGTFSVEGRKITFVVPWAALGGAQKFKWYANDSWVQSGLVTTSYAFDEAPNFERAHYP